MRYFPRIGIYKNSTGSCTFYPNQCRGYSYGWWRAVDKIGPFVVLNAYHYSSPTGKHLCTLRSLLSNQSIKIDFRLPFPKGINEIDPNHAYGGWRHLYSQSVFDYYTGRIETLRALIAKPKTHKAKNEERKQEIRRLELELKAVMGLRDLHSAKGSKKVALIARLKRLSKELSK
jgi:hypothetical protein